MRIVFDIDSNNWVDMIDSDVEALVLVSEENGKKRVKVTLLLDNDMLMDTQGAEEE